MEENEDNKFTCRRFGAKGILQTGQLKIRPTPFPKAISVLFCEVAEL